MALKRVTPPRVIARAGGRSSIPETRMMEEMRVLESRSRGVLGPPLSRRTTVLDLAAPTASFRDAPLGAGPESILPIVVMDSLMCNCTSKLALRAPRNDGERRGRPRANKNAAGCPAAFEIRPTKNENPYSSSAFLPPMVFSLANTASTLRSSRCFSVGSNSGSFLVVSEAGSRVAPP
jgi:hypothetical protein